MVPSVLMVTPVNPPSLLILILSAILASVAAAPSAKSVPFPLSANTLTVVPPALSNGVLLKSSFSATMVGKETQNPISGISSQSNIVMSGGSETPLPKFPSSVCPTKQGVGFPSICTKE